MALSAPVVLPNFSFPKEPVVQRNRLCHIPVRLTRDAPRFRLDLLDGEIVLFMPVPTPQGDVKSSLFQAKRNKSVSDDVKANNATPLGTSRLCTVVLGAQVRFNLGVIGFVWYSGYVAPCHL